jgi:AraC family transcriptional regulator
MTPRIETLPAKTLIGKRIKMTITADRTFELWHGFMPFVKSIKNRVSTDLFCMQVYDHSMAFKDFNPETEFEKWAAVEVSTVEYIPENMETYSLKGGLYAVFIYKGVPNEFHTMFQYIFYSWLPNSEYEVDQREYFEILGDKYKNNDPDSEEEVWIPIKRKELN